MTSLPPIDESPKVYPFWLRLTVTVSLIIGCIAAGYICFRYIPQKTMAIVGSVLVGFDLFLIAAFIDIAAHDKGDS